MFPMERTEIVVWAIVMDTRLLQKLRALSLDRDLSKISSKYKVCHNGGGLCYCVTFIRANNELYTLVR